MWTPGRERAGVGARCGGGGGELSCFCLRVTSESEGNETGERDEAVQGVMLLGRWV